MRRGAASLALAVVAVAATLARGGDPASVPVRALDVERSGWQRVALDARALAQAVVGRHWAIEGPDGKLLPTFVLRPPPQGFVAARTLTVGETPGGFSLVFDLGPAPFEHDRLVLDPARPTSASRCRLEASSDLRSWSFLAEGDLFRIGDASGLTRSALAHPPTGARYLRLFWPARAGFPELLRAGAEAHTPRPLEVRLEVRAVERADGRAAFELELEGPGLAPIRLELRGALGGDAGAYRLYRAAAQRWETLAEGLARASPLTIELDREPLGRSVLRLELFGRRGADLALDQATAQVEPMWLVFDAPRAGTYTLVYGTQERAAPSAPAPGNQQEIGPVVDVVAGTESVRPMRVPQMEWAKPKPLAKSVEIATRWSIVFAQREAPVVCLALPSEAFARVDYEPRRLRLLAGDRDVPRALWSPHEPEPALAVGNLATEPAADETVRRAPLGREQLSDLSQLEVLARNARAGSTARLVIHRETRPGVDAEPLELHAPWSCLGHSTACRATFAGLPPRPEGDVEVQVELEDPLADLALDLRGWRARRFALFVRPEGREVFLAAIGPSSPPPDDRAQAQAELLLSLPFTDATVDLGAEIEGGGSRLPAKALLVGALVLVAVVLLWVLARGLRRPPAAQF